MLIPAQPGDDGSLGADTQRQEARGNPAEHGAETERGDQEARAGVGEPELVGVARDQRRERDEQHRVDEQDRADEDEQASHDAEPSRAHAARSGNENAPSRWLPRPTSRLTSAEATADRRAINLRRSVLGALGTLAG